MRPTIQQQYIPEGRCYGCGPARADGLQLRSYADDGRAVASWVSSPYYEAVPGVLNGGVIGTLLDCHSGAALALAIHERTGSWPFADGVRWATIDYTISMQRPTPTDGELELVARTVDLTDDDATVEGWIEAAGKQRAAIRASWRRVRPRD